MFTELLYLILSIGYSPSAYIGDTPSRIEVVSPEDLSLEGSKCYFDAEVIFQTRQIYTIESNSYDFPEYSMIDSAEIYGDNINIISADGKEELKLHIPAFIQDGRSLDVEAKFALVEGSVYIYWRETFQNRIYRFGLLGIRAKDDMKNISLSWICEGTAGSFSE